MSSLLLPPQPDPDDAGDAEKPRAAEAHAPENDRRRKRRSKHANTPGPERWVRILDGLPGLIATRVLTTSQANAITRACNASLQHHHRAQAPGRESGVSDADVVALMKQDPRLFSMLEPLLTDEQIEKIVNDSGDGAPTQN